MELPEKIYEMILAKLTGDIDREQEAYLRAWLEESEGNREAYREFCSTWYSGRWANQREGVNSSAGWEKITLLRNRRKRWHLLSGVAAAASVVLVVGLFWIYVESRPDVMVSGKGTPWETAEITLRLSTGEELNLKKMNQGEIQEEGSVIRSDSACLEYQGAETGSSGEMAYNELIIPKCGEYRLRLSDGSSVVLNSESRLRFPVNFTGNIREVFLEGEACFEVAKDSLKPFIVHASGVAVRVLGTLFNVSAYKDEDNTEVTLVNGAVSVDAGDFRRQLVPDEQLVLNNRTLKVDVRSVDGRSYVAWSDGLFRFDAMPLELLMKKLSRWFNISYEFEDESLKNVRFTGGFRKYDDICHIVQMIGEITEVAFSVEGNKVVINKKQK